MLHTSSKQGKIVLRIKTCRIVSLFLPDPKTGKRPCSGRRKKDGEKYWKEHVLFHEYFHGDSGAGLGASHQTGWTALIANILLDLGQMRADNQIPKCRKEQQTKEGI